MSSISEFFSRSTGAGAITSRITHGSTYQRWTFGCCNSCCQCIPSSASAYAYELWGQGAGGAGAMCCMWGSFGGSGGRYAAARVDYSGCSSNRQMCFCACSCYCCNCCVCNGHCGQFTRMCLCGLATCNVAGGGCQVGCTQCFYQGVSNCNDCNFEAWTDGPCYGSGGGGLTGLQNCNDNDSVCSYDPDPDNFAGGGSSGGGNPLEAFCTTPCSCGLHRGNGSCSQASFVVESQNRGATCGWGCGRNVGVSVCRGVGGASWGGAGHQFCCKSQGNWAYAGCMGHSPGGGGSSGGVCGDGICWGGVGGAGLVIVSVDT